MAADVAPASDQQPSSASAFWWRLADNAFRRWFLFLLPVVVFAGLGVYQSTQALEVYRSDGRLNATGNPLVPDAVIGGAPAQFWETPADVTSRTLDEQLLTDSFVEDIAIRANLGDQLESGFLRLGVVRSNIWTSTSGSSLVTVSSTWADPATSLALVEATISGYQGYIAETVASDAREAVAFYSEQLEGLEAQVDAAEATLTEYVANLPVLDDGEEMGVLDRLGLERLTAALATAEGKVLETEDEIERAELNVRTAESDAGRSLTVIDAPEMPVAPESTLIDRMITVISYTVLGIAVATAALLVSTVLDRSIVSRRDLVALAGVSFVAEVPVDHGLVAPKSPARRRGRGGPSRGSRRKTEPTERIDDTDAVETAERAGV